MMRVTICAVILLAVAVLPAQAQQQPRMSQRAPMLRARVEEAFLRRARQEMALNDDQAQRLGRVLEASGTRRADLDDADRLARKALMSQLRPGIGANADSVVRLVDAITANRVAHAETFRSEMRELNDILSPVQRGQFLLLRDRMLNQVRTMLNNPEPTAGRPRVP
ncbi:MAG: hypothetical protein ABIR59_11510 [Gemmatimonadales bacterium]